jgi:predicted metallo-beta-lactamase superfamily hydrolase
LPELLSVDGERVKFFSQTRVKSADKKENSQYIINELLLKDVQKSTSSSQKKRHFDYQTVDKDGIAGDDNLKEDYLAQR